MATATFGGDPRRYSHYVKAITDHLYETFHHKISGDSKRQWRASIDDFRTAIWDQLLLGLINERRSDGTEVNYEVYLPLETFRVFGWLDDTDLGTDRPRAARTGTEEDEAGQLHDTQQAFYK
jgi:hypothetical protein